MALSRRELLGSLPWLAAAWAGCSWASPARPSGGYRELLRSGSGQGKPRVVVLMPDTAQTREVWTGLSDELSSDVELIAVLVQSSADEPIVARALAQHRPSAIVLLNNPTVAAYRAHQRKHPGAKFPACVVLMTSLLEEQEALGLENATGIRYEVPLVSVVTNLRRLIASPIQRVGVVYRRGFRRFVEFEAKLAARENVQVVPEWVSDAPNESELKRALRQVKNKADLLWVLNDDRLLTPHLLAEGWVPGLAERPFIPTIVGARSLVSAEGSFGTFAVLPDHTAFGAQAAEILFQTAENGWALADTHIQLPVSTTTIMDLAQAQGQLTLRADALSQVDVILRPGEPG
jgi:hypothetical protein